MEEILEEERLQDIQETKTGTMSRELEIAQMNPWQSQGSECEFDCIGCPYLLGVSMMDKRVYIDCDSPTGK